MSEPRAGGDVEIALATAETAGFNLVIKGRTFALIPFLVFIAVAAHWPTNAIGATVIGTFVLIGFGYLWLIRTGRERPWHRYGLVALDISAMVLLLFNGPLSLGDDIPQIMAFRAFGVHFVLLFVVVTALSLSPGLVIWAGTWGVLCYWGSFLHIVRGMERTVSWSDMPKAPTVDEYMNLVLDPDFIASGNRIMESMSLLLGAVVLAVAVYRTRKLLRKQTQAERARASLARYVSPNLVDELASQEEPFGPVRRQRVAILFVDMVGFTSYAERASPEETVDLLRAYHGRMARLVFAHGGTVDDYVGDEVMAVFGTPQERPDDPVRALACGLAILDELTVWNRERTESGLPPVRVGIGLHCGEVVVGNTGNAERLKFAVVGDAVNVASRLERATRDRDALLIASGHLVEAAQQSTEGVGLAQNLEPAGPLEIRNRQNPVAIWVVKPA